jgi:hypothetical protein
MLFVKINSNLILKKYDYQVLVESTYDCGVGLSDLGAKCRGVLSPL